MLKTHIVVLTTILQDQKRENDLKKHEPFKPFADNRGQRTWELFEFYDLCDDRR